METTFETRVELTPQQALYFRQRAKGRSVRKAAGKAGVSHQTGYNWEKLLKPQLPKA